VDLQEKSRKNFVLEKKNRCFGGQAVFGRTVGNKLFLGEKKKDV